MSDSHTRTPITVTHAGGLRFAADIRSHRVITDQSAAAGGGDSAPSPIELLSAALGSCVALYVHQFCVSRGLADGGMRIEVLPHHLANPSRIGGFDVTVHLREALPAHAMEMLERVVRSCPAHNTLAHGAAISVSIESSATAHANAG